MRVRLNPFRCDVAPKRSNDEIFFAPYDTKKSLLIECRQITRGKPFVGQWLADITQRTIATNPQFTIFSQLDL
ncbi:Uncharacterised protein [Vibrio cholerae]|nr:Uncharacterised protein [Vibrio cholerae]